MHSPHLPFHLLFFCFVAGRLNGEHLCPEDNWLSSLMLRANNFTGSLDLRSCTNLTVLDLQVSSNSSFSIWVCSV